MSEAKFEALLARYLHLIRYAASLHLIPKKLEKEDLVQEASLLLWKRYQEWIDRGWDVNSRDFEKLIKTELWHAMISQVRRYHPPRSESRYPSSTIRTFTIEIRKTSTNRDAIPIPYITMIGAVKDRQDTIYVPEDDFDLEEMKRQTGEYTHCIVWKRNQPPANVPLEIVGLCYEAVRIQPGPGRRDPRLEDPEKDAASVASDGNPEREYLNKEAEIEFEKLLGELTEHLNLDEMKLIYEILSPSDGLLEMHKDVSMRADQIPRWTKLEQFFKVDRATLNARREKIRQALRRVLGREES